MNYKYHKLDKFKKVAYFQVLKNQKDFQINNSSISTQTKNFLTLYAKHQ